MGNKLGRSTESKFTKSTGLYPHCEWDEKAVKKLINKKKIAPRYPGREDAGPDMEECPICFLWYPGGLNRSKCCRQPICTECFLQFKKPSSAKPVQCPFCNAYNYSVKYVGAMSKEEKEALEQEEQKVIAAQIRIKKEELERQEQREKELQEERLKRAQEPPPPTPPSEVARPPAMPGHSISERPAQDGQRRHNHAPQNSARPRSSQRPHEHQSASASTTQRHRVDEQRVSRQQASDDGDDDFQVDVEELMVMEAIRLSLLDSRAQGQRESAVESQDQDQQEEVQQQAGREVGESDDDDDDAAYLESVELSDDENWPATTVWQDRVPPGSAASLAGLSGDRHSMGAASSNARSCFFEELLRVDGEMADEDASGAGVEDLLSYNQSWFRGLMPVGSYSLPLPRSPAAVASIGTSSSPSHSFTSSPSAVEPASTLSSAVSTQRPSDIPDEQALGSSAALVGTFRERGVTPTRHQHRPLSVGWGESLSPMTHVQKPDVVGSGGTEQEEATFLAEDKIMNSASSQSLHAASDEFPPCAHEPSTFSQTEAQGSVSGTSRQHSVCESVQTVLDRVSTQVIMDKPHVAAHSGGLQTELAAVVDRNPFSDDEEDEEPGSACESRAGVTEVAVDHGALDRGAEESASNHEDGVCEDRAGTIIVIGPESAQMMLSRWLLCGEVGGDSGKCLTIGRHKLRIHAVAEPHFAPSMAADAVLLFVKSDDGCLEAASADVKILDEDERLSLAPMLLLLAVNESDSSDPLTADERAQRRDKARGILGIKDRNERAARRNLVEIFVVGPGDAGLADALSWLAHGLDVA